MIFNFLFLLFPLKMNLCLKVDDKLVHFIQRQLQFLSVFLKAEILSKLIQQGQNGISSAKEGFNTPHLATGSHTLARFALASVADSTQTLLPFDPQH